jgi:stalled ribosome rescue protein Dom34
MTAAKRLGIWMDHSNAHLMEFTNGEIETKFLESEFTHDEKSESMGKSENLMHNKEQQKQGAFYKKLEAVIRNYDEVLLFGPTTAKNELANLLKDNHQFEHVKVIVEQGSKMTTNQEHTFVKDYFTKAVHAA